MSRIKLAEKRDKFRYLVNCLQDEKEFIDTVARRHGFQPTAFVRDAALERARKLFNKDKNTDLKDAVKAYKELEDVTDKE